ncbi:putative transcription factor GRF family [Helianthus debilis subsp. tardiflorus]
MVLCNCGEEAKILTSWTDLNPGRRFYSCPKMNPGCRRFIGWVDPPMCSRSVCIIPGLLRNKNQLEAEIARLQGKNRLKNKLIVVLLFILGILGLIIMSG